jgi:nucleoside-diphosphate-sugar epimerase
LEAYKDANLLKGGLVFADAITTVSDTYAEEIKTDFYGEGLNGLMNARAHDLRGIVNGIDYEDFNPATDPHIYQNYDARDFRKEKIKNKLKLQEELGLEKNAGTMMIGIVSRLTDQKGFDLIERVMDELCQDDIQFVILGTGGERFENCFRHYDWKYADKVSANIFYSEALSHKIYAACEAFLMQMYRENNFPVTIVRPSHTYGDKYVPVGAHGRKGNWQILQRMLSGKPVIIHGDGTSLWTITNNRDFAKGFVGLMRNPHAIGEAFHITSDESVTWNQLYATIAECLGVELKAVHVASEFLAQADPPYDMAGSLIGDKANSVVFDNSKLKRAVPGFQAAVTAAEGIRRTVEYMTTHPECQVEDPEFDDWCDRLIEALETAKKAMRK